MSPCLSNWEVFPADVSHALVLSPALQAGMDALFRALDRVLSLGGDIASRAPRLELLLRCVRSTVLTLRMLGVDELIKMSRQSDIATVRHPLTVLPSHELVA